MRELRDLDAGDRGGAEVWRLLGLSVEVEDDRLRRIRDEELPRMTVVGAVEDGAVLGFAAYDAADAVTRRAVTIHYIATSEAHRGEGLGTALIRELRRRHPELAVRAQTDDDAIGFYRRLGFASTPAPRDPRWPERQRYDCVLAP